MTKIARSNRLIFVSVWVGLIVAMGAWAASTPLGASPDEPAHIVKAASVVRGQFIGSPTEQPAITRVSVPVGIAKAASWNCYAFNVNVSASCIPPLDDGLKLTPAITSAGLYNPLYYAAVGWPSLFIPDTATAVLCMRLISSIITSFFLAVTFTILMRLVRPLVGGIVFFAAVTPMVLFLGAAVNPNALEIASGAALASSLFALVSGSFADRTRTLLILVAVSGVVLANMRGLSPLWMGLIGVGVLIATPWPRIVDLLKRWDARIALTLLALGVIAAGVWLMRTNTLNSMGVYAGSATPPLKAFFEMLFNHTVDPGIVGVFGWLDTPAPGIVYMVWCSLFLFIGLAALVFARGRTLWGFVFALATVLLVPPVVQALSVTTSGYIWQGRYTIVAVVSCLVFAAVAIDRGGFLTDVARPVATRIAVGISLLVGFGQIVSMLTAITRYAAGNLGSFVAVFTRPTWSPPLGAPIWLVAVLIGTAVMAAVWLVVLRDQSKELGIEKDAADSTSRVAV